MMCLGLPCVGAKIKLCRTIKRQGVVLPKGQVATVRREIHGQVGRPARAQRASPERAVVVEVARPDGQNIRVRVRERDIELVSRPKGKGDPV